MSAWLKLFLLVCDPWAILQWNGLSYLEILIIEVKVSYCSCFPLKCEWPCALTVRLLSVIIDIIIECLNSWWWLVSLPPFHMWWYHWLIIHADRQCNLWKCRPSIVLEYCSTYQSKYSHIICVSLISLVQTPFDTDYEVQFQT